jgi:hypothetical protein
MASSKHHKFRAEKVIGPRSFSKLVKNCSIGKSGVKKSWDLARLPAIAHQRVGSQFDDIGSAQKIGRKPLWWILELMGRILMGDFQDLSPPVAWSWRDFKDI